ncbi:MAG: enoyl-CoA hydratase/isomerase family protein [Pseudomonadota bacterium]
MTDDIQFEEFNGWGVVTLNRPEALNALTLGMVKAFRKTLLDWQAHPKIRAVLVKGAGDRAFCAGGDIRWLHDTAKKDVSAACDFFREEYRNNAVIYHFTKPYVSLIDGVVMGGGVGVSVHGDFRVAGDRTLFAMPETGIGLFPDVGGGHFMPRLHDGLGLYYALTGARAKAADCMAAGIATHYTPTEQMPELETALLETALTSHAHADVEAVLDQFAGDPGHAPINDLRAQIKAEFEAPASLDALLRSLERDGAQVTTEFYETLSRMSPTSLALTFRQMREGHALDFDDVMRMEFRMVSRVMQGHDFFEGVRAQILDKDRQPKWSPSSLSAVSDADIDAYFEPLGDAELVFDA